MATLGFPWHGPRLLQAASTAVSIDLLWRAKEWNHRKMELCFGMVTSKIRHVVGQSTGRHLSFVLSGSCLHWFLSLFLPDCFCCSPLSLYLDALQLERALHSGVRWALSCEQGQVGSRVLHRLVSLAFSTARGKPCQGLLLIAFTGFSLTFHTPEILSF